MPYKTKSNMTREEQVRKFVEELITYKDSRVVALFKEAAVLGMTWADAHPKNPWISVEERLPDKVNKFLSDEVLVRYLRGGKEYKFVTHYDYEYQTWNIPNVTHWMPIIGIGEEQR